MKNKFFGLLKKYKFDIVITEFPDFLNSSQLTLFENSRTKYINDIKERLLLTNKLLKIGGYFAVFFDRKKIDLFLDFIISKLGYVYFDSFFHLKTYFLPCSSYKNPINRFQLIVVFQKKKKPGSLSELELKKSLNYNSLMEKTEEEILGERKFPSFKGYITNKLLEDYSKEGCYFLDPFFNSYLIRGKYYMRKFLSLDRNFFGIEGSSVFRTIYNKKVKRINFITL